MKNKIIFLELRLGNPIFGSLKCLNEHKISLFMNFGSIPIFLELSCILNRISKIFSSLSLEQFKFLDGVGQNLNKLINEYDNFRVMIHSSFHFEYTIENHNKFVINAKLEFIPTPFNYSYTNTILSVKSVVHSAKDTFNFMSTKIEWRILVLQVDFHYNMCRESFNIYCQGSSINCTVKKFRCQYWQNEPIFYFKNQQCNLFVVREYPQFQVE